MHGFYLSSEINDYACKEFLRDIGIVKDVIYLYSDDYEDIPSLKNIIKVIPTDEEKSQEIFNFMLNYEKTEKSIVELNFLDAVKIYNVWKNQLILVTNQKSLICACETLELEYISINFFINKIKEVCYDLKAS